MNNQTTSHVQNFHVLKISFIGATDYKPSRVKIASERFKQSRVIEYNHEFNNTCDIAEDWLRKNGFNLTGHAEGKDCYYVITDTFEPLKKVKS